MQGHKEKVTVQRNVVGDKVTRKGKGRDKPISRDLVPEKEKRLLQIAEHQERWKEHPNVLKDIFRVCMEQFMEDLLGTV